MQGSSKTGIENALATMIFHLYCSLFSFSSLAKNAFLLRNRRPASGDWWRGRHSGPDLVLPRLPVLRSLHLHSPVASLCRILLPKSHISPLHTTASSSLAAAYLQTSFHSLAQLLRAALRNREGSFGSE